MNPIDNFFEAIPERMGSAVYDVRPVVAYGLPGGPVAQYARGLERYRVGFARAEDHFLFIPWDGRMGQPTARLLAAHRWLKGPANASFRTPHSLRFQIPSLAVVAVSAEGFDAELHSFAVRTNLTPWYGGEVGQVVLIDLLLGRLTGFQAASQRASGSLALYSAQERLRQVFSAVLPLSQV